MGKNPHRKVAAENCSCGAIAPELLYADMCDACAEVNNFDRTTAFQSNGERLRRKVEEKLRLKRKKEKKVRVITKQLRKT